MLGLRPLQTCPRTPAREAVLLCQGAASREERSSHTNKERPENYYKILPAKPIGELKLPGSEFQSQGDRPFQGRLGRKRSQAPCK